MPDIPTYNETLEPNLKVDGFLFNKGEVTLEPDFSNFDTHICMCYEYSKNFIFEPEDNQTEDTNILICYDWSEG